MREIANADALPDPIGAISLYLAACDKRSLPSAGTVPHCCSPAPTAQFDSTASFVCPAFLYAADTSAPNKQFARRPHIDCAALAAPVAAVIGQFFADAVQSTAVSAE